MDKDRVRAALLSARLFADTRSHPFLRADGPGVMTIHDSLKVLRHDGASENPITSWLTRFRIAGALTEVFHPELPDADSPGEPRYADAANELATRLQQVAKEDVGATDALVAAEWKMLGDDVTELARGARSQMPPVWRDHLRAGQRVKDPRSLPIDWQTDVTIYPGGATKVTSSIEVDRASFSQLARLCDPRRWHEGSLFWFESSRLDDDGRRLGPPPELRPDEPPASWSGQLLEVVGSTVAVFSAVLDIQFEVEDDSCLVQYKLIRSRDGLVQDEGYAYVTKVAPRPGGPDRYRTQLVKWVDFDNAPFGGPSVLDQFLPSYIGSWLRVQQDLWAAQAFLPE